MGVATIDDDRHHLSLSFDDKQGDAGSGQFTIDIASLGIGGEPGQAVARGDFDYSSPETGPYKAQLDIEENSDPRSEEHTSELQSLMRISYAVFCFKKKTESQYK